MSPRLVSLYRFRAYTEKLIDRARKAGQNKMVLVLQTGWIRITTEIQQAQRVEAN